MPSPFSVWLLRPAGTQWRRLGSPFTVSPVVHPSFLSFDQCDHLGLRPLAAVPETNTEGWLAGISGVPYGQAQIAPPPTSCRTECKASTQGRETKQSPGER